MNICIYGAASDEIDKSYLECGEKLGVEIASRNHSLVFGGGATGLMGAVARGVDSKNGTMIGIAPRFFDVDGVLYKRCTELVFTDTMRQRKEMMEQKSDAFIVTPGGIGTFEEFLEILTLRSLGRHKKPIALFNTNGYYDKFVAFLQNSVEQKFLRKEDMELMFISDSEKAIIDYFENFS